eukprot:12870-Heterococcus_DN1.PRE.1
MHLYVHTGRAIQSSSRMSAAVYCMHCCTRIGHGTQLTAHLLLRAGVLLCYCSDQDEEEEMNNAAQDLMIHQLKAEPQQQQQQQIGHLNIYTAGALSSTANSRLNSPHSSRSSPSRAGSSSCGRPAAAAAAAAAGSQRRARSRSEDSWHSSCSSEYFPIKERPIRSSRKRKLKAKAKAKQGSSRKRASRARSEDLEDYSGDDDGCIGEHYILLPSRLERSRRMGARSRFTDAQNATMKAHLDMMIDRRDFYLE